jgi:hypothetical protein
MNDMNFEAQVKAIATRMDYPRTPDVAGTVTARIRSSTHPRFPSKAAAWLLSIVLILLSSLMLIPPARAAIIEFIRIGAVRIFPQYGQPTDQPTTQPTYTTTPEIHTTPTSTPKPSNPPLISILDRMIGRTTLASAREQVDYPIPLPTYPANLGEPDYVFTQDVEGTMTILVWIDPQQPDKVLMSLHFIPSKSWAINKMGPKVIQETQVNGKYAIWAEGPYPLRVRDNNEIYFTRMVEGHVLIWEVGKTTYRLETDLSMEETITIAESLALIP